jgi:hypothetical protein
LIFTQKIKETTKGDASWKGKDIERRNARGA